MTPDNSADRLSLGISLIFALNIFVSVLLFVLGNLFHSLPLVLVPFVIGLVQLLYIIPIVIWSITRQRWEFMKGVIIAAVITAFLNGGCWLLLFGISL